jgi:RNA polymerase sigma-70 factor (ECF subfamily)
LTVSRPQRDAGSDGMGSGGEQNAERSAHRAETEALMKLVYDELRREAERYFRRQPPGFTLRPTEMVNEACINLIQNANVKWQSPEHFRAVATRKIWQVVVDHLRQRNAQKRGGAYRRQAAEPEKKPRPTRKAPENEPQRWQRVPLDAIRIEWRDRLVDFLDLAEALEALAQENPRLGDVVKLHWFGGLTYPATAAALNVSASTVEKDFRYALAWLNRWLSDTQQDEDGVS